MLASLRGECLSVMSVPASQYDLDVDGIFEPGFVRHPAGLTDSGMRSVEGLNNESECSLCRGSTIEHGRHAGLDHRSTAVIKRQTVQNTA